MNCQGFEDRLSQFLDGELTGVDVAAFEAHARSCTLCGLLLEGVQENLGLLRQIPEVDPPPRVAARAAALAQPAAGGPLARLCARFHLDQRRLPRLAAAAILLLFGFSLTYNLYWSPPAGGQGGDLVSLVDYTGNRLFTQAVQVYQSAADTWQSMAAVVEEVNNFFRSNWRQVKDAFRARQPEEKKPDDPPKELNRTGYIIPDICRFA